MISSCCERSRLGAVHARLARRLTLKAFAGLGMIALAAACGAAAMGWALHAGWNAADVVGRTLHWLAAGVLALGLCHLLILTLVSAPQPQGIRLPRGVAGALHYRIDEVAKRLAVPPVEGVWITDEMNAAVLQRPRYGCFGRIETHLMIGLPLAHCLSRRQFLAVLAHEFGHLAVQRRALGGFGAHLRAWWLRFAEQVAEYHPLLAHGLDRRFHRYTLDMLRLSRLEEFAADAIAARLVGRRLLGEALIEVSAKDRFLREDYWPKVMAQSNSAPEPRFRPFREMGLGVTAGFNAYSVLNAGFRGGEASDEVALHPTPAERLRALRVPVCEAVPPARSAASHYLSALLPRLAWAFDRHWWSVAGHGWRRSYRRARGATADADAPR